MSIKRSFKKPLLKVVRILPLVVLLVWLVLPSSISEAQKPIVRSLLIGDTTPAVVTDYTISWQYAAPFTVGSMRFEFCDTAYIDDPCGNPGGSFAAATLAAELGETGFSVLNQSANHVLVSRPPALTTNTSVVYTFSNVTNPGGLPTSFFVRILIYPSSDGTGPYNNAGSVMSATTTPIVINTEVPPELVFCVGLVVDVNCSSFSGNWIDYGDLTPVVTDFGTSMFGVVTNASGGYVVTANGIAMTSGSNVITAINPPNTSFIGTSQFGMNLRANTVPAVGQDPGGTGTSVIGTGYDTPDIFKFVSGDIVALSPAPTFFNMFTVSYIVNVSPAQPGGIYNTTITYVCTAAF